MGAGLQVRSTKTLQNSEFLRSKYASEKVDTRTA
jgi:hypothetical protein